MNFFKKSGVFKKNQTAKGFQPKQASQTFILEPLITPSGLVDCVDHTPQPLELDLQTTALPEVDLPDLDTDHTVDHAPSYTLDTGSTTENIPHSIEQPTQLSTLDELNLHNAIAHDNLIATHTVDTPIADHQLEPLPFINSLELTTETSSTDTYLPTLENSQLESCNQTFTSGVFTVGDSGKVSIDYLFDGGQYQGQLAIFSLDGMEQYQPGSTEFITEAASRALSNSNLGHLVISDASEAARFNGLMGGEPQNWNSGEYQGVNSFSMRPGEQFGIMLVPNGTVQQLFEYPNSDGAIRPLFSMSTANPNDTFHVGQIADVNGHGSTFVMEDVRVDGISDRDYNDLIFQVRGATGTAVQMDQVINPTSDWRSTDMGKALIAYAKPYDTIPVEVPTTVISDLPAIDDLVLPVETPTTEISDLPATDDLVLPVDTPPTLTPIADTQEVQFDFPAAQQPLIGVIDTGFSADNPDLDYSQITLGRDYVAGDDNPLLQPTEGSEHGTHVLGVIAATNDNDIGVDGINDDAPIWVSRATGSGQWANSLVDFVDYAQESGQPNAVINLSLDLTQINPDGSVTTRYEFTPQERAAIEYARQHDVLIVVAAGNDGAVMSALGQSSQEFDNIITVGASDGADRADYSSFGYGLDILAPGGTTEQPVLSTVGDSVGTMAGTSVATAQVTGAASQVWAANPDLSYRQVIELLKITATDLSTPNWDLDTGAGLLNIAAAVGLAKVTTPEPYTPDTVGAIPTTWTGEGKVTPSDRAAYSASEVGQQPTGGTYASGYIAPWKGSATLTQDWNTTFSHKGNSAYAKDWVIADRKVYAAKAGKVVFVKQDSTRYGASSAYADDANYVIIRHDDGYESLYLHLQAGSVPVKVGDTIQAGTYIGQTGLSGWTTGEHLHFAVRNPNTKKSVPFKLDGNTNSSTPQPPPTSSSSDIWSTNFSAWVMAKEGANVRSGPGTAYQKVGSYPYKTTIEFDAWTYGETITDVLSGKPDARWYRIKGTEKWVSSAIVFGNAPGSTPLPSNNPSTPTPPSNTVSGSFNSVWQQYKNTLGNPTSGVINHSSGATYQLFQNGSIVSSKYGTFALYGGIRQAYLNTGGLNGWLGAPKSAEYSQGNGVIRQDFANGYIIWNGSKATAYKTGTGTPVKTPPPSSKPKLILPRTGGGNSPNINVDPNFEEAARILPDEGAGKHGAKANQIGWLEMLNQKAMKVTFYAVANSAEALGMTNAARHMRHYLDNTGSTLNVNVDQMLRDLSKFKKLFETEISEAVKEANARIAAGDKTQPMRFSVNSQWDLEKKYYAQAQTGDWHYAVGGFYYRYTTEVETVPPLTSDGEIIVKMTTKIHVFDRYNWDKPKGVNIAGVPIADNTLAELHKVGIAKEYNIIGSSSAVTTTWTYPNSSQSIISPDAGDRAGGRTDPSRNR